MKQQIHRFITNTWHKNSKRPGLMARTIHTWMARAIRARRQRWSLREKAAFSTPIVVIGNITIGGTGKTPLLLALAHWLTSAGVPVGVVSRGYGAQAPYIPFPVTSDTPPQHGGDEPCLIAQRLGIPVMIDPNRRRAVAALLERWPNIKLVLSDDGLQHYALERAVELVVIDGQRRLGNGLCLPVGPLREPLDRLSTASLLVINGGQAITPDETQGLLLPPQVTMTMAPETILRIPDQHPFSLSTWRETVCATTDRTTVDCVAGKGQSAKGLAVAGIGNPERFFHTLRQLGIAFEPRIYPDHHVYTKQDVATWRRASWVIMTEKDAIKLRALAHTTQSLTNLYALRVNASLDTAGWRQIASILQSQLQPWPEVSQALAQLAPPFTAHKTTPNPDDAKGEK